MGANAQTSVPAFTAGQVLTAAQMTQVNTGIPVFASSTERDAAFGGTGEKTLAEGQMAYLEDTNETQVYDGSVWGAISAGGLVFISRTTIGSAVSSVTVSGAFSTDYDNYRILVGGGAGSGQIHMNLQLGATTTGYHYQLVYGAFANTPLAVGSAAGTSFSYIGACTVDSLQACIDLQSPFLTENTFINANTIREDAGGGPTVGVLDDTTSYTAFTLSVASGTMTGGYIDLYGYAKA